MTSRGRFRAVSLFIGTFFLLFSGYLWAQDGAVPEEPLFGDIPERYERTIRDVVERYEEARRLLQEQIQRNAELYTTDEVDLLIAGFEAEVARLEAEKLDLRQAYKDLLIETKNYRERAVLFKEELDKTKFNLHREIDTLRRTMDVVEEENLFQVGTMFSPLSRIGGIGIFNLPGAPVSLLTEGMYDLRAKEFTVAFGVVFGFLPQSVFMDGYQGRRGVRPVGSK